MAKLQKHVTEYGRTPNLLLNNKAISLKAKGIFAFIESKPNDWEFSVERLRYGLKEGTEAITSALKELEEAGYLLRERYQDTKGHWQVSYNLYEAPAKPQSKKTLSRETPIQGNPDTGEPTKHTKKDYTKKDIQRKKAITNVIPQGGEPEDTPATYGREDINELIQEWTDVVGYEMNSGMQKQRRYATHLIRKYGLDATKKVLHVVALSQQDKYAPKVTNLESLWFKWNDLGVWLRQKQAKDPSSRIHLNTNLMTEEQKLQAVQAMEQRKKAQV